MAFPFDRAPDVREYVTWLVEEGGGRVKEGVRGTWSVIRLETDDGYAYIAMQRDDEPLAPSKVASLDRRLNVNSPFPKPPLPYS